MAETCPKCGGEMDEGRIPAPHKWLLGYKSDRQKHWSFEANVEQVKACMGCGYLEFYLDPEEVRKKVAK
jgi:predicted nucleic-acid-binding Zn-ribbon protein